MQFLYPQFLWALAALAIPVIIHLFYFRRYKRILFSNVRFLREIKEETSARNKLRNLLILLMRCLAIAALVCAFAQPFIPVADQVASGTRHVSVFVDNSFSMQAFGDDLPLLDRAKQRAREVVSAYGQEDKFQITTHDLSADQQRYMNQEEALNVIEEVDITPSVSNLSRVLKRQQTLLSRENDGPGISYLLSDFQKSITDLGPYDTLMPLNLVPIQSVRQENATIDTAWFDTPAQILNQTSPLIIRMTNHGTGDLENVKLTMTLDGQEKPLSAFDIASGESMTDTAQITILKTGWHEVILRITDFPVQFDDTWYLSFYVKEEVRVLALNGGVPNPRLTAAFGGSTHYVLDNQPASQVDFSAMRSYDLVILNGIEAISTGMTEALYQYMESDAGRVLFFPAAERPVEVYHGFLTRCNAQPFTSYDKTERTVGYVNRDEFIFNDVFIETRSNLRLPVTTANYVTTSLQRRGVEKILGYRDGSSFLDKYNVGNGVLLVCNAPLSDEISDFSRNAEVFIPLLYKAAISATHSRPTAYVIGHNEPIEVDARDLAADQVFTFKGSTEFIPGMTPVGSKVLLTPGDQIREAGFYQLFNGDTQMGSYAFNYDRTESYLECITPQDLSDLVGPKTAILQASPRTSLTDLVSARDRGIQLWKWCIALALLFLLLEILLIRLLKG
jgi:hypothetical protein